MSLRRLPSDRRGLSLIEVLSAVVIVAILGAIIIPVVNARLTIAHIDGLQTEMQTYVQGIRLFERDVGKYPSRLDYLNQLPGSGATDVCGNPIIAQNQAKFRGPYINKIIALQNLGSGNTKFSIATDDSVDAAITRTTIAATTGTQQVLQITIIGPDQNVATMVDSLTDGAVSGTAGIVRYSGALAATNNTIFWTLPIKNGAC